MEVLFEDGALPGYDLPDDLARLCGRLGFADSALYSNFVSSFDSVVTLRSDPRRQPGDRHRAGQEPSEIETHRPKPIKPMRSWSAAVNDRAADSDRASHRRPEYLHTRRAEDRLRLE